MIALDKPLTKRQLKQAVRRKRREAYHRDIESPVRHIVRVATGIATTLFDTRDLTAFPGAAHRVMGTHETLEHARRRPGWT